MSERVHVHEVEPGRHVALGKLPAQPQPTDFQLLDLLTASLPTPPSRFGHGSLFTDWGMLGNDRVGDCFFAGADHESMLFERLGDLGVAANFTAASALSDYSAVTGYNPADPNTDRGTYVTQGMSYRRKTGLVDANGARHKLDAYAAIPAGDWKLMLSCVYVFGAVGIGFEVPESAMRQFQFGVDGEWTDAGDRNIVGGHYVPIVGSMNTASQSTLVTWGQRWRLSEGFYVRYNDEAWVPLSLELVKSGYGLHHLDVATLEQMLAALPHG